MTDRILEIADTSARLRFENKLLCIELPSGEKNFVPVADIGVLIISNPAVMISSTLLSELGEKGAVVILSNTKRLPVAMQIPIDGNYAQTERFRAQANATLPLKKQMWKTVVKAKIFRQAEVLQALHGTDYGLKRLHDSVKSGDPENMEAQAAKIYWQNIFEVPFRRDRDANDNNMFLNYGYSVLRAIVARACCGAGLHPTIGINHHNAYNVYCLADDMMEPFRPVIDKAVYELNPYNFEMPLEKTQRHALISCLLQRLETSKGNRTITDLIRISCEQLATAFITGDNCLKYD